MKNQTIKSQLNAGLAAGATEEQREPALHKEGTFLKDKDGAARSAVMRMFHLGGAVAGLTVALLILTAGPAARGAVPVPIANPGFEDPPLAEGAFDSTIPNWTEGRYNVTAPAVWVVGATSVGVYNVSTAEYTSGLAQEGENMAYTTSLAGFNVGLNQVLAGATATLQADTQYELSAVVGNPYVYNGYTNTANYRIELVAGGVVLATSTGPSPTNDTYWTTASLSYSSGPTPAQLGQQLEIRLLAVNLAGGYEVDFDSVSLTATYTGPTSNANLSSLAPSTGTLTPPFSSGTFSYAATVPYATTSLSVTPVAPDPSATITVNGHPVVSGDPSDPISLNVGANVITTVVVSQDTTATNTYTIAVTRTGNADLAYLEPSVGTLTPAFDSGIFGYTASAPYATNSMTVTPWASDPGATIKVNGSPVASLSPSGAINLNVGANVITTVVISADATATNTYTLTVTRDGPITVVNTATFTQSSPNSSLYTLATGYSTVGVDKLVVTAAGENANPGGVGVINSVTYAGTPMALAIKVDNTQGAYKEGAVGIYYLDNPSQYGEAGDIVASVANFNSFGGSVMSLVGTAQGVDATNSALATSPTLAESVSIGTKSLYNVVVAATENGTGNTGVQPFAQPPLTEVLSYKKTPGNVWTAGGSGYQFVSGLTNTTSTFTNASTTAATTLAASFGVAVPSLYWDVGGETPNGSWDAVTANWNTDYTGSGSLVAWSSGQTAVFAAGTNATGAYTITVDGTRDITGLSFEEGTPTLSGGTALRLSSLAFLNAAAGLTATVQTPLSENAAGRQLVTAGSGTIILAGNNSYTGNTTVAPGAGTLDLAGNNVAASGGMTLNGGVTLFESPASINGTARSITVNSGGAVAFGSSFGAGNIPAALSGRIVATSAGAIAADNYDAMSFNFNTPGLTAASLGAAGSVSYSGTLTPNGTTYRLGGGGGTLTMANANAITGVGNSLAVNGNVTLPAANDFTAGTTLNAGILGVGNDHCLGSGGVTFTGGGISSDSASARTVPNAVTLAADLTLGDPVNNGKLTFTGTAGLGAANRILMLNSDAEFAGAVSGIGVGFTKNGAGTLTLSGANTYSGATAVNVGTLVLLGSNNSAGATTINNGMLQLGGSSNGGLAGGTLTFGAQVATVIEPVGADRTITNSVVLTYNASAGGVGTISGSKNLVIGGTFTHARPQGGGGTLTSSLDPGKTLTLSGQVRLSEGNTGRTLTINGTGETRISGQVVNGGTGACGLTKSGTGLLVLGNDNLYTGVTTAGGGALLLNSANALPGGIGTVGGRGALTLNGGVLGLGAGDFTRSLAAAGVTNGVSFFNNAQNTGAGGGWAAYGADRVVNLGGASETISWFTADTGLNDRKLILGAPTATHMVTLQNPLDLDTAIGTVQVDDGAAAVDATLSGALIDWGGLVKTGAGTLQLTAANTYYGETIVSLGTLLVNGSIDNSAMVTVETGATLAGSGTLGGSVTVNGTISPGASVGTLTSGSQVWNGGGAYRFELRSAVNSAGMDRLDITGAGTLNVWAALGSEFTIKLVSMADATTPGPVPDFDPSTSYTWVIATASGGIPAFDAGAFVIDAGAFANPHGGTFSVAAQGNNLVVNYTGAPPAPTIISYGPLTGTSFPLTFGGPNGQSYQVLTTTNLALPLSWTVISSGAFGDSPATYTDSSATNAQQFYRIKSP